MRMDDEKKKLEQLDQEIEWSEGSVEMHPAGIFRAEFVGYEKATDKDGNPDPYKRLRFIFETEAEKEDGEPFRMSCKGKATFNPKGRVRPMLTAFGLDVDKINPAEFFMSKYVGSRLTLVIEHKKSDDGKREYAEITSFQPYEQPKRSRRFNEDAKAAEPAAEIKTEAPAEEKRELVGAKSGGKSKFDDPDE